MKNSKLIFLRDFLFSALLTFLLASISHTQFVLYELSNLNIKIDWVTRLQTTASDIVGFFPAFTLVITLGLAIGFSIVGWFFRRLKSQANWYYPVAGGLSLLAIHLLMHPILEITLIAGARSHFGLAMQVFAGICGGWLFYRLRMNAFRPSN